MLNFLFGPLLIWVPRVFYGTAFVYGVLWYFFRRRPEIAERFFRLQRVIWTVVIFRIAYAALASIAQYSTWSGSPFTKLLLPPHSSIWYFYGYVGLRLWLNVVLSIGVGYLFYRFLKRLKTHNERFFEEGEVELGCLLALTVGWPSIILFVIFTFGAVVLVSLFRMIMLKEQFTTLGAPFLLAAFAALIWGTYLIDALNLGAFKA